ncbi:MAG: hypothetical protein ACRD4X_04585 [Candidatus Acidiferrales bacterium]
MEGGIPGISGICATCGFFAVSAGAVLASAAVMLPETFWLFVGSGAVAVPAELLGGVAVGVEFRDGAATDWGERAGTEAEAATGWLLAFAGVAADVLCAEADWPEGF